MRALIALASLGIAVAGPSTPGASVWAPQLPQLHNHANYFPHGPNSALTSPYEAMPIIQGGKDKTNPVGAWTRVPFPRVLTVLFPGFACAASLELLALLGYAHTR